MRNLSMYAELQKQAARALRCQEETMTHLKTQLNHLIQKYTFVMFSKKLGFKLNCPPCDDRPQVEGELNYSQEFKDLVIVAIREYMQTNRCQCGRAVRHLSKVLNVKKTLLYAWIHLAEMSDTTAVTC